MQANQQQEELADDLYENEGHPGSFGLHTTNMNKLVEQMMGRSILVITHRVQIFKRLPFSTITRVLLYKKLQITTITKMLVYKRLLFRTISRMFHSSKPMVSMVDKA